MKKTVAIVTALTTLLSGAALAVTDGQIDISGEIYNQACSLAPGSSPINIKFDRIPVSALANGATAGNIKRSIQLDGCDTQIATSAIVTYTPSQVSPVNASLAAFTSGDAKGAGVGLKDSFNKPVTWGEKLVPVLLNDGKNEIPFTAYVQAESDSAIITPGLFETTINFSIEYQ